MDENCKHMRLREWLIAQVESGSYAGLRWEDQQKSMFRIPWKHAAKQDYNQNEDAALFKAWAVYKGKYKEGKDPADPSVWKTRLRCALNKSLDFREVPERSQLDISEPYKVYKIQPEGGRATESPKSPGLCVASQPGISPQPQLTEGDKAWRQDRSAQQKAPFCYEGDTVADVSSRPMFRDAVSEAPLPVRPVSFPESLHITDLRLQVQLFYQGNVVLRFTTSTPEGCRILHGMLPTENERIYGPSAVEPVCFPSPVLVGVSPIAAEAMKRLLPHLQRGVLLWMASDGLFAKRFCQCRVYWDGPMAQRHNRPNKLEREKTCKLLDTAVLLQELIRYLREGGPRPHSKIDLCFGEEFPEADRSLVHKLITARVEPLFVKQLLEDMHSQRQVMQAAQSLHALKGCANGNPQ